MNVLKKLHDKSKIWFAVAWIIAYCVLMSVGDALSAWIGIEKSVTLATGILLSAILLLFLKKNGLFSDYGLCKPKASAKFMLYYIPILVMLTANLWYGVTLNYGVLETVLYILAMLCVGFLEEVIFRGLLFEAMRKDNVKAAIIVSSVTFGIGHIINLINGSGAELIPNILQVVYATAAGFMFVMMYYKSKSLLVCIAAHGIFNALSVFANEVNATNEMRILTALLLTVITGSYALYLAFSMKGRGMIKFTLFLENARFLSDKLGIVPLLYGSIGLEYLTGDDLGADDIDILVPRLFITERWHEFKEVLEAQGYVLADEHEHTFVRDGVAYSYADIEDLESFAGVNTEAIEMREADGVRFLLLTLEQYLAVYQKSSKDGYRVNVRQKKDADKIRFIESKL